MDILILFFEFVIEAFKWVSAPAHAAVLHQLPDLNDSEAWVVAFVLTNVALTTFWHLIGALKANAGRLLSRLPRVLPSRGAGVTSALMAKRS